LQWRITHVDFRNSKGNNNCKAYFHTESGINGILLLKNLIMLKIKIFQSIVCVNNLIYYLTFKNNSLTPTEINIYKIGTYQHTYVISLQSEMAFVQYCKIII